MAGGMLLVSGLWPPFGAAVRLYVTTAEQYQIPLSIVSGYRSMQEQARLYAQGRTAAQLAQRVSLHGSQGTVTDAPPGYSPHNYGLAVDIESTRLGDARELARVMGFGLVSWDMPHLEWPGWKTLIASGRAGP